MVARSLRESRMSSPPATRFRIVADQPRKADCSEPTDEALMTRVQAEDRDALVRLFERYSQKIRRVVTRILRDVTEADDVVQDLFLFIQRKARIFDSSKS